jgi:hypothetical protein
VATEPLRSCNEIEIAKILRRVREHAFWVTAFDAKRLPSMWRDWVLPIRNVPLRRIDDAARERVGSRRGGIPDVVAWNTNDSKRSALFVECKGAKERFDQAQEDWLWTVTRHGLSESQCSVSVRPF